MHHKYGLYTLAALLPLPSLSVHAVTVLKDCFNGAPDYYVNSTMTLDDSENEIHKAVQVPPGHLQGSGAALTANCSCPKNMLGSSRVVESTFSTTPLAAGTAGYGYLTEDFDIDVSGYTDTGGEPYSDGLVAMNINSYPTSLSSSAPHQFNSSGELESEASVCSDATKVSGSSSVQRRFSWNVIAATLYVKKPILGEVIIPSTLVVQNYACLAFGAGSCTSPSDAVLVSNIWFGATITAPLSCTINAGSTIEVDLGNIVSSQFVTKGQPPAGYALKSVDITYHCTDPSISNDGKIKLTLRADQGVSSDSNLIAKMLDRDDIGVRMFDQNDGNVALDGTADFPVSLDSQGNGVIQMKAAPVSTTNSKPQAGAFEGNVTVEMSLR